ncbi:MAG TPA: type II toxin-antitoxin system VapC family toxin [Ktedonobacteraceae bacterium]|nr:type II toxin-antitoxin system VapC family toxin [Ktedonobacteraceae bacterium]
MVVYFLDSSAIVKRYFYEKGHDWVESLHDPIQGHALYIAQAALVEVVASICRKAREQNISFEERDSTIDDFRGDVQNIYSIWLIDNALYTAAGNLCRLYRLRAYDAIQLACAIAVREDISKTQLLQTEQPDFIFVSADVGLLTIASAAGLSVENPNNYV